MRVKCRCGKIFSPDHFKPLLTENTLHKKVTALCLESAEKFIKKYDGRYSVSINISQVDINNKVFFGSVERNFKENSSGSKKYNFRDFGAHESEQEYC